VRAFRCAVEAYDHDTIATLLADDVVITSPVSETRRSGKAVVGAVLRTVSRIFEDFRYTREIASADGREHALIFAASIGGVEMTGCDFLHLDADGKIDDFTVMVRPLSAAKALAEAMAAQSEQIRRAAAGA
jgi:hypothetical protein